jgi:YARHG domain
VVDNGTAIFLGIAGGRPSQEQRGEKQQKELGMRPLIFSLAAVLAATVTVELPTQANAQADTCDSLWVARNAIYKAKGFCFKTPRAISYFGNAGCRFDDEGAVPLTSADQAAIASIQARERALGCQD